MYSYSKVAIALKILHTSCILSGRIFKDSLTAAPAGGELDLDLTMFVKKK